MAKATGIIKPPPGAYMNHETREQVGLEVISSEARLRLTRLLRRVARSARGEDAHQIELIRINQAVNIANTVLGRPIYSLELSDWDYLPAEYGWHYSELELVLRRPDTVQLVEILADLIEAGPLNADEVNAILKADGCGIRFEGGGGEAAGVILLDLADLQPGPIIVDEHINVRKLVDRMDRAMAAKDWPLVLHTAASIFETVAKDVVPNVNVQGQSLGGWFDLYRKYSRLAAPLLDTIQEIFTRRNVEPLAGHGSLADPSSTESEAIQVRELTLTFVRLERLLVTAAVPLAATINAKPLEREKGKEASKPPKHV